MEKQIDLVKLSESLKAIAHPDRIRILTLLAQKGKINFSVTEISDKLELTQPEASRHLSILKNKNVLSFERVGSNIYYSLNKDNIIYSTIKNLFN